MPENEEYETMRYRLKEAVGRYSDYREYWLRLSDLDEMYDESEEIYNFKSWMGEDISTIVSKASTLLGLAEETFRELYRLAEDELYESLKEICRQGGEPQKQILKVMIPENKLSKDSFEELLDRWEYRYNQDDAMENFLGILQQEFGDGKSGDSTN